MKIGDKVICINNDGCDLKKYLAYTIKSISTSMNIEVEEVEGEWRATRFEKLEYVNRTYGYLGSPFKKEKVIHKWEDLNGVENGKGLRIEKRTDTLSEVLYGEECIKRLDKTIKLSRTIKKLKAMGFDIEFKEKYIPPESPQQNRVSKTIRKIEELDGLENGKGLSLKWHVYVCEDGSTDLIDILANNQCFYSVPFSDVDDELFRTLKAMGFEFEWKPKRSLEEVLNDYKEINFVVGQDNCAVYEDARNGGFSVGVYSGYKTVGTKYYLKKDAERICEELNAK